MQNCVFHSRWARLACALLALCLTLCLPLGARAAEGDEEPTSPYAGIAVDEGDEGDLVSLIQDRLGKLGYYAYKITGTFGEITEAALREFQRENGLTTSGIVDEQTATLLLSDTADKAIPSFGEHTEAALREFQRENGLTTGDIVDEQIATLLLSDASAMILHERMKNLRYYTYKATSSFGEHTEAALREFQRQNGLTMDGVLDGKTAALPYSSAAKPFVSAPPPPSSSPIITRAGDQNALVSLLQARLIELGFYSHPVSDYFNDATKQAVQAFQSLHNLSVDGIVGEQTMSRLFAESFPAP